MQTPQEFIPVTIDKSHITTIGERLYAESIEFVRELVNNAYDADVEQVEIVMTEDAIEIRDNGSGMDMEGLRQHFNIGSQQKLSSPKSPRYNRDRIGMFGIGKFASLSACKRFEVITRRDDFVGSVIFDKEQWEKATGAWQLPFERLPADFRKQNGTTVVLKDIRQFQSFNVDPILQTIVWANGADLAPEFLYENTRILHGASKKRTT
jgi:HSP90 family molecular chaperone